MPGYIITNAEVFRRTSPMANTARSRRAVIKRYGGEFLAQGGATEYYGRELAAAPDCRHQI